MTDECTDCETGIEPTVEEEKVDTTMGAEIPKTEIVEQVTPTAEVPAEVPAEKPPVEIPEDAEISGMLGLLTAGCLLTDEDKREACWKGIEPLETNNEKPLETVKRIIAIDGVEPLEKT